MAGPSGHTTTTTLANLRPQMLAEAQFTLQSDAVMEGLMHRERLRDNEGLTYRVPKIGTISATSGIVEGSDFVNPQPVTDSLITFTPQTDGCQVIVTDDAVHKLQGGLMRRIARVMGNAMTKAEELTLVTLLDGFSNTLGSAGTSLTYGYHAAGVARVRAGAVTSATSSAEPGAMAGKINAVYAPFQIHALKRNMGPVGTYPIPAGLSQDVIKSGEVFRDLAGASVHESAFIDGDASDDAKGGVFAEMALWFITTYQRMSQEEERDASLRATEINLFNQYAGGEYFDVWGAEMLFDNSAPSS